MFLILCLFFKHCQIFPCFPTHSIAHPHCTRLPSLKANGSSAPAPTDRVWLPALNGFHTWLFLGPLPARPSRFGWVVYVPKVAWRCVSARNKLQTFSSLLLTFEERSFGLRTAFSLPSPFSNLNQLSRRFLLGPPRATRMRPADFVFWTAAGLILLEGKLMGERK